MKIKVENLYNEAPAMKNVLTVARFVVPVPGIHNQRKCPLQKRKKRNGCEIYDKIKWSISLYVDYFAKVPNLVFRLAQWQRHNENSMIKHKFTALFLCKIYFANHVSYNYDTQVPYVLWKLSCLDSLERKWQQGS